MYALLSYGLRVLFLVGLVLAFSGVLSISGFGLLLSASLLVSVCYITNVALRSLYGVAANNESWVITALILSCILPPSTDPERLAYICLAGVLAITAKYVLSLHGRHIFNPAACGAAAVSLLGLVPVVWWVGTPYMLPATLIFGLLILRKLHRFQLFFVFAGAALLMLAIVGIASGQEPVTLIKNALLSGPLIFFATVMLTEPATMPSTRRYQLLFALLVGTLYSAQLRLGILSTSPHLVLLVGNVFAFAVNPRYSLVLKLKNKLQVSPQVFDYEFTPSRKLSFQPGQYMEWTLPHKGTDLRGNRRTFTIASSPTESAVHLGVKFYEPSSSFKRALKSMKLGDTLTASHMGGDFLLPADPKQKLVFIAGGVGITPFRSMLKYLVDTGQKRNITLFYIVNDAQELAYKDVFQAARAIGLKVVPLVASRLTIEVLKREVPNFASGKYYLSGPPGLVKAYSDLLKTHGINRNRIITDYFPGY